MTFLNKINQKTASTDLALIQRNTVLEKQVKKLEKELLEQKLLMLEYKTSTEAKLEESKEALREAMSRLYIHGCRKYSSHFNIHKHSSSRQAMSRLYIHSLS
jgi:hypothetical protein